MKCRICEEELKIPDIICPICGEKQYVADSRIIEYLIYQYKEYKNNIIQYSKDSWDDTYKTKAIKRTKIEVFKSVMIMLKIALEQYAQIDTSKIEVEEHYVSTPKMCEMNRNKVYDGCGDC